MKICDMVQAYTVTSGGVRTYLDEKRRFLLEHTEHEHVLVVPGEQDRIIEQGRARTYEIAGPIVRGAGGYRFVSRVDKMLRILGREAPDMIEVGDPYLMPWIARYHRWRRGTPAVGFYHTDFPRAYAGRYARRVLGGRAASLAESGSDAYARLVYGACDAVIASTPALFDRLVGMNLSNVHRVPLGVDLECFHPRHRDRRIWERIGVDPTSVVLLYVGRIDAEKRSDLLVRAFRAARLSTQVALVLVGEGPLRSELVRIGREDARVHVLPYVHDRGELASLLASADLYVTAGPHETFALSVIEAQASGLGVVGVAAGALIDRVSPSSGVLAAPDSVESLALALETALRRDRAEMGRCARSEVERAFSWRTTFSELLALYHSILDRHRPFAPVGDGLPCVR